MAYLSRPWKDFTDINELRAYLAYENGLRLNGNPRCLCGGCSPFGTEPNANHQFTSKGTLVIGPKDRYRAVAVDGGFVAEPTRSLA